VSIQLHFEADCILSRMLKMLPIVALAMVVGQVMSTVEQSFTVEPQNKKINCQVLKEELCQDSSPRKPCQKVNLKLVTHGFRSSQQSVEGIRKAWLDKGRIKTRVIILNWKEPAGGKRYTTGVVDLDPIRYKAAAKNALDVGTELGKCLAKLTSNGLDPDKIHLVGHSLGAHLVGKAGREFRKETKRKGKEMQVGHVTGLDPAGPGWVGNTPFKELKNEELSKKSAKFVDVIHTNGDTRGKIGTVYFGALQPLGHIDFYADGGRKQAICSKSVFSTSVLNGKCSHSQAIEWFRQSIQDPKKFKGEKCDDYNNCTSGTKRTSGTRRSGTSGTTAFMGDGVRKEIRGYFFVKMPTTTTSERSSFEVDALSVSSRG